MPVSLSVVSLSVAPQPHRVAHGLQQGRTSGPQALCARLKDLLEFFRRSHQPVVGFPRWRKLVIHSLKQLLFRFTPPDALNKCLTHLLTLRLIGKSAPDLEYR